MSSQTTPANPLAGLEAAELAVVLKPVFSFLTALQQPGANIETAVTGVNSVELQEVAQLPAIEAIGINNVAAILQAKVAAWQATVGASASTPAATPTPSPAPAA